MIIGVLKEPASEARVSLSPETVAALVKKGCDILVEMNAGANAFCSDADFIAAGAKIEDRASVIAGAEVILSIQPPNDLASIPLGKVLVGVYQPLFNVDVAANMASAGHTAFSLDMLPRTTRAQAMDVEEAHNARREKEAAERKKKADQEDLELGLLIGGLVLAIVLCAYGIFEVLDHCAQNRCGR
jgi:NAD/NADP transhydrogenase alpha subunit